MKALSTWVGSSYRARAVWIPEEFQAGCDLVILSKFGQLEALRSGLIDAFIGAVGQGTPILTAVSPAYARPWSDFAESLGLVVPAEDDALDNSRSLAAACKRS